MENDHIMSQNLKENGILRLSIEEKENINNVWEKLKDPNIHKVVQTAPAVRVALGEGFGIPIGTNVVGKMVSALKQLGFDRVFDTNTGADFTIVEEANEFVERLKKQDGLPMLTSCCPIWVRYAEKNYPDLLNHLSTCKSPHQMLGAVIKSYYAKKYNIDPKKICMISAMPCVAKKDECRRKEMEVDGIRDVDYVITTRELAIMIKQAGIEFNQLPDSKFDAPMGEATGAGAIFGTTGGVMEAALRTAADILEGRDLKKFEYKAVRGNNGRKETIMEIAGNKIKAVVVNGLINAKEVMDEIRSGQADYQFVEVMACQGGCVMGAGQPIEDLETRNKIDVRKLRAEALYTIDEKSVVRKAHKSPIIQHIYSEFFGKPGSKIAEKYLHIEYAKKNFEP